RPVPGICVAPDDGAGGVGIVVPGTGAHRDGIEATLAERSRDHRAREGQIVEMVAPALRDIAMDLGFLFFPDQRGHHALAQPGLEPGPGRKDREKEALYLGEEDVLVECRVMRLDGGDARALAIDAVRVDARGPRPWHHLPEPLAAGSVQRP